MMRLLPAGQFSRIAQKRFSCSLVGRISSTKEIFFSRISSKAAQRRFLSNLMDSRIAQKRFFSA